MNEFSNEEIIKAVNSSMTMAEAASKLNMHFNTFKKIAIELNCYKPNQGAKGTHKKASKEYLLEDIMSGKYPGYQTYKLKNKLIKAGLKKNICEMCGIVDWNGKPLNMELHHIDGNRNNNKLENLIMLCPNCHAQTENYRSKNIKK